MALLGCGGSSSPQHTAPEEAPSPPDAEEVAIPAGPKPADMLVYVHDTEAGARTCWLDPRTGEGDCPLAGAYPGPRDPTDERLVVVQVDGPKQRLAWWDGAGGVEPLTAWAGAIRAPTWAPDGSRLVFASPHEGVSAVWAQARDGGEPVLLDHHRLGDFEPTQAPDGRVAFGTSRDGNAEIYALGADGPERLTDHPGDDVAPAYSPSGDALAWLHTEDGVQRVWVRTEGKARPLLPEIAEQEGFAWSPDGALLAVTALAAGQRSVLVADREGEVQARIELPGGAQRPTWSADGRFLAVESSRSADEPVIAVSHISGKGAYTLVDGWLPRFVARAHFE